LLKVAKDGREKRAGLVVLLAGVERGLRVRVTSKVI
jgi:predicted RNA-binding protein with TRAM domain